MLMRAFLESRFETLPPESISQNPSQPLISALGGLETSSGVAVSETAAETIPAAFSCDKVIKEDLAKVPIKLKRINPDGTRQDDRDHPVYVALHDYPNRAMTPYEFKELSQHWLNFWGNAYAEVIRKRGSVELWPLEPWRMTVDLDAASRLRYRYRLTNGRQREWIFDPANPPIFHLRQNCQPWYLGRSPIRVLRETFGWAIASQGSAARFYGQGMLPAGVLQTKMKLEKPAADRVRGDFEKILAGQGNFHRIAILDRGLEWTPVTMPAKDAEFLASLKYTRSQIGGIFRVPSHKINDLERATFSNIEHQAIEWATDGLMPHFVNWQQAIRRDLLNPISFNTHFATFVVDALVQADIATRNNALQVQRQNGVISANDWKRAIDSDDLIAEEDGGNLHMVNAAMVPMRRDPAATIEGDTFGRSH